MGKREKQKESSGGRPQPKQRSRGDHSHDHQNESLDQLNPPYLPSEGFVPGYDEYPADAYNADTPRNYPDHEPTAMDMQELGEALDDDLLPDDLSLNETADSSAMFTDGDGYTLARPMGGASGLDQNPYDYPYLDNDYPSDPAHVAEAIQQSRQDFSNTMRYPNDTPGAGSSSQHPMANEFVNQLDDIPEQVNMDNGPVLGRRYWRGAEQKHKDKSGKPNHSGFRVEKSHKFRAGAVFKLDWYQPAYAANADASTAVGNYHSGIRRFIVVNSTSGHSICIAIYTYGRQGCTKPGCHPLSHGIAYDSREPTPGLLEYEPDLGFAPVPIRISPQLSHTESIDPASRINYAKLHTVEHNLPVRFIGEVVPEFLPIVDGNVNSYWTTMSNPEPSKGKQKKKHHHHYRR